MLDSFPFPLSNWPGINSTEDGRPPGWTTHRRMSGRHRHVQIKLMRKVFFFFSANCTCSIRLLTSAEESLWQQGGFCRERLERLAISPGDHCAFQTARHRQEIQGIKDQTANVLGSFYFVRRDHRVHEWFSPDGQATVLQVLEAAESPLSPVLTASHPCAGDDVTGSHSSCSHQFSPGFSDLVNWALAGSLWPPNASLLFCQKEVLMLLG